MCCEGIKTTVGHAITLIRSESLSDVAEYAYAATAPAGSRLIFLAGACPLTEDGTTAAAGDYPGQAAKAFDKDKKGAIVNSSRAIIAAWKKHGGDYTTAAREEALKMREELRKVLYK